MNTAIQCIILLACVTICTSHVVRLNCRCVNTNKSVDPSRIAKLTKYDPRPYCNHEEIIVTLKDGSERCLDPKAEFIQIVVRAWQKQMIIRAANRNAGRPKPTTA